MKVQKTPAIISQSHGFNVRAFCGGVGPASSLHAFMTELLKREPRPAEALAGHTP